jgi:hypothetical protein
MTTRAACGQPAPRLRIGRWWHLVARFNRWTGRTCPFCDPLEPGNRRDT